MPVVKRGGAEFEIAADVVFQLGGRWRDPFDDEIVRQLGESGGAAKNCQAKNGKSVVHKAEEIIALRCWRNKNKFGAGKRASGQQSPGLKQWSEQDISVGENDANDVWFYGQRFQGFACAWKSDRTGAYLDRLRNFLISSGLGFKPYWSRFQPAAGSTFVEIPQAGKVETGGVL
jgi:hypothetical protein